MPRVRHMPRVRFVSFAMNTLSVMDMAITLDTAD
jgi:hypothetical protein